jgi:ribA/ribD-fused uncharacterized protein
MVKAKNCRKSFTAKTPNMNTNTNKEDPNMPIFFYMPDSKPYGMFCQWFPAAFSVPLESFAYLKRSDVATQTWNLQIDILSQNLLLATQFEEQKIVNFNCAEQYMMCCKALYFSDFKTAARVMAAKDPKAQKLLGRQVHGFKDTEWMEIASKVVETGTYAKFTQINRLKTGLLRTEDRQICEAASKDPVWGIGYNENAARQLWNGGRTQVWGQNRLGKALIAVRERIRGEQGRKSRGTWDCYDEE